jgi:flagellar hook-associated protein 1
MSLMTSIYTGVTGLQTSSNALNTTAHNLANINTNGYVRQQVSMVDGNYQNLGYTAVNTKQVGLGVVSAESRHIRDLLLDNAYREQEGRRAFYASRYNASEEVETILGETEGVQFQNSLKDLKEAISEMAKTPNSTVTRAGLIMSAEAFITRAGEVYNELIAYQKTMDSKVSDTVDRINQIGDSINALNLKIASVESAGVETASDLRDSRDLLLDELGSLTKIDYQEGEFGVVTVRIEGTSFVNKDGVFHMGKAELNSADGSNYLTPVWPNIDNAPVYDTFSDISTANNNDIGELKGLLIARGSYVGTYKDIPHEPDYSQYATEAERVAAYEQYQKDVKTYNETVGNSVISKTQAMFDQMINNIVTLINDAISPTVDKTFNTETKVTVPAGTVINTLDDTLKAKLAGADVDADGALVTDTSITLDAGSSLNILNIDEDENGCSFGSDADKTPGTELFSRKDVDRYTVVTGDDGKKYYVYNPYNEFGSESSYSLDNITVNQKVVEDYSFLPFTTAQDDVDIQRAAEIIKIWDTPSLNLDPSNATPKDFDDYYSAMVGVVANEGFIYNTVATSQQSVVLSLDGKRQSIQGVSSEEELTNMIKFQNAYGASSRYINTVAEMIDTLINRVGNY